MLSSQTPKQTPRVGPTTVIGRIIGSLAALAVVTGGILTFAQPSRANVAIETSALPTENQATQPLSDNPQSEPPPETGIDGVSNIATVQWTETAPAAAEAPAKRSPAPHRPTLEIDELAVVPTSTPTPQPIDDIAVPTLACSDDFAMGRWTTTNVGSSGTPTSLAIDTAGSCETVTVVMDATTPSIDITRVPFLNWTMLRFDTANMATMPNPDLVTVDGDVVLGALTFHDSNGPGVFISHPLGVEVAANVLIDGDTVTVEFRSSQGGDATMDAGWGGEPYSLPIGGLPQDGLAVILATELEASGEIGIVGYARAPEANVVIRIWDGGVLVDEVAVLTEGPAYAYGRFSHNAFVANGTYTVEIGWDSPSGIEELDVWYSTEVTVIGAP